jgi:mono/diheme cytochrome c family protein
MMFRMIRLVSMLRTAGSRRLALVGLAAMFALWAGPGLAAPDIRAGQALARVHCAECHAIGRSGRSIRPAATPFRLIPQRYPVEALEEAFGEGITGSHKGMPDFAFSPRQVDDLLGYIKSLGRRR